MPRASYPGKQIIVGLGEVGDLFLAEVDAQGRWLKMAAESLYHVNAHFRPALEDFAVRVGKEWDQFDQLERQQAWLNHILVCSALSDAEERDDE